MLPLGAFQGWLKAKLVEYGGGDPAGARQVLARVCRLHERRLFAMVEGYEVVPGNKNKTGKAIRREKLTVSEDVVDRALQAEGSTFLWELYPHLYVWTPEQWDEFHVWVEEEKELDRMNGIDPFTGEPPELVAA